MTTDLTLKEEKISTTLAADNDPNFDRKLDLVTAGAHQFIKTHLLTKITRENCKTIIDYIIAFMTEVSPADSYRIDTIHKLKQLAEFHNPKSFRDMTRQDVIGFLERLRKPESVDMLHQWVGTYENSRIVLLRFFKWLYYPNQEPRKRPKPTIMDNIPKIKRKEKSIYKPTDLWTEEDDALFYKYCPSLRDKAWHAVSRDTGCRPHEMLKMRIKDIVVIQTETYQIAKITVNGKTGTRTVRLNNSYPHLKKWLSSGHPFPSVPNAPIFCGIGKKNTGRRLSPKTINQIYDYYKNVIFPRVLQDPTVPPEDKQKIQELRKKRWNPYVRRHLAATEISKTLKDSVLIDQYLGWSHTGNTRQKYQHYYQDDALDAILQADGLIPTTTTTKQRKDLLKPKICPNCDESNTPDTKFCVKCKYVLSYDAYNEVTEEAEQTKRELAELKAKQEEAARKQQMDMERITAALEKTQDHLQLITAWNEEEQRVTSERLFLKASSAIAARATKKKKEAAADITTKRAKIE